MRTANILVRFLEPVVDFLPAETARKIIDLHIDPEGRRYVISYQRRLR